MDMIARQREQIETLQERVRQLEEALAPVKTTVPHEWRLTATEARLFAHLTVRNIATTESIMAALYSDRAEEPVGTVVQVWMCKLRKKLKPLGITIENIWGQGYSLRGYHADQRRAA